ncbi:MAG: hypothetical protein JRJ27_05160, partial [Deltaproteobacteria bacterium]|nr:hypothetical protein [Deltaproteobacteria bacterium]
MYNRNYKTMTGLLKTLNKSENQQKVQAESGVLLRGTRSLDPETGQPCPARVVEKGGAVYLERTLSSGKTQCSLVESDADFYKRFGHVDRAGKYRILNHFFYVTSQCNLKCPVCFEGMREVEEP